jgi:hypothetical protein
LQQFNDWWTLKRNMDWPVISHFHTSDWAHLCYLVSPPSEQFGLFPSKIRQLSCCNNGCSTNSSHHCCHQSLQICHMPWCINDSCVQSQGEK